MNGRNQLFVTRKIPQAGLDLLAASEARVTVHQEDETKGLPREELLAGVRSCDVLLCQLTEPIDREVLAANERLLGVAQMAVGYDNVEVDAATELGVPVANTPGVLTDTTADLAWALLMAIARRIPEAHQYMVAGRYKIWGPNLLLGQDVSPGGSGRRKVLGIVGYGRIGQAVARRAAGFEMDVLAYDPFFREGVEADELATWADLPELLERSDFITLHPALTEDTQHLIGEAELRAMKPTACLINASRGPVIDERALVRALQEGWIAGAALDVYEDEPAMAPGLAECPNAVLVPHIGSATRDTRGKMATMAATNALAHLRRERAPNCVNPEVYDTEAYRRRVE
ncbi:MAG TPA: D-glycerate dehydrogenase [Thermoanaerobaculia bacterium]|nr:D-glycerate dehydrogenase [Thermoanaerobaculia bacterium]